MNQVKEAKNRGGVAELSPSPAQAHGSLVGWELDAVVAERVMGCKLRSSRTREPFPLDACGCNDAAHSDAEFTVGYGGYLKGYSTDIAAAMEVVEKMHQTRNVEIWRDTNGGWRVCFEPDSFRRASAAGPSLPDVICRAALAAIQRT